MARGLIRLIALVGLGCVALPAHAKEAEKETATLDTPDRMKSATAPRRRVPWYARVGNDLYFENHGPEGAFWGWTLGAEFGYRWPRDFIGLRGSFSFNVAPYKVELSGVRLEIRDSGPRLGVTAGSQLAGSWWLLGELAAQYDNVTVQPVNTVRGIRADFGRYNGWGMRASLGVGWDVFGITTLTLSATCAVPFQRNHYDVEETSVSNSNQRLFTAWALQPGVSLSGVFF